MLYYLLYIYRQNYIMVIYMSVANTFQGGGSIGGNENGDVVIQGKRILLNGDLVLNSPAYNLDVLGDITCAGNIYAFPTSYPALSNGSAKQALFPANQKILTNNTGIGVDIPIPANSMGVWTLLINYVITQPADDGVYFQIAYSSAIDTNYAWVNTRLHEYALTNGGAGNLCYLTDSTLIYIKTNNAFNARVTVVYGSASNVNTAYLESNQSLLSGIKIA